MVFKFKGFGFLSLNWNITMNPSIKEQVAPHFSQVKAEGATRAKRIREVTTQAGAEAIAEVQAGYQSIQGIFKEMLQGLKTTALQTVEETKAKGTSTAKSLANEQVVKAKTKIEVAVYFNFADV
jgi:hypothetical protein